MAVEVLPNEEINGRGKNETGEKEPVLPFVGKERIEGHKH